MSRLRTYGMQDKGRCYWHVLVMALAALFPTMGQAAESHSVSICFQPEIPPRAFYQRDAQGKKSEELVGASVDLLRTVFGRLGLVPKFNVQLPWKRCLALVEAGTIDFAMDAYHSEERALKFLFSDPYWRLTPQVYYLKSAPLSIGSIADLKRYRGCGMGGWSYAHYGLGAEDMDAGSFDFGGMVQKLKAGRCKYIVEELEVVEGLKAIGQDYFSADIVHGPVSGALGPATYLISSKDDRHADLIKRFDQQLRQLSLSGDSMKIWKKYAQLSSPKP